MGGEIDVRVDDHVSGNRGSKGFYCRRFYNGILDGSDLSLGFLHDAVSTLFQPRRPMMQDASVAKNT